MRCIYIGGSAFLFRMSEKRYVIMGDVISSRKIPNRDVFNLRLFEACNKVNNQFKQDIFAQFKILKGVDEIGAVLLTISNVYNIITEIQSLLYPQQIRFVVVYDDIDVGTASKDILKMDIARMDGPAFHKASDLLWSLKKEKLIFNIFIPDKIMENSISSIINLLNIIKRDWSENQIKVIDAYKIFENQKSVAQRLEISQQAVSNAIKRAKWKEIKQVEEKLEYILKAYKNDIHK